MITTFKIFEAISKNPAIGDYVIVTVPDHIQQEYKYYFKYNLRCFDLERSLAHSRLVFLLWLLADFILVALGAILIILALCAYKKHACIIFGVSSLCAP
jgi:hypothetical protein